MLHPPTFINADQNFSLLSDAVAIHQVGTAHICERLQKSIFAKEPDVFKFRLKCFYSNILRQVSAKL